MKLRPSFLLLIFLAVAASVAAVASQAFGFNYIDLGHVAKAIVHRHDVLMVGNSVIQGVSKCDDDERSIAEMTSSALAAPVLDFSRGGMQLHEELALIRSSVMGQNGRVIVLPLAVADQLLAARAPTVGRQAWLGHLTKKAMPPPPAAPTTYKGIRYGTYPEFSAKYFTVEKASTQCPEVRVSNPDFVTFMYWLNFARHDDYASGQAELIEQFKAIQASGNILVVAIFPYNWKMVADHFGQEAVAKIDRHVAQVRATLGDHGIRVVDLSKALAPTDFTDIWCACGHLNQHGRMTVAQSLAGEIKAASSP